MPSIYSRGSGGRKSIYNSPGGAPSFASPKEKKKNPSTFSRIMDILSRGNYAMAGAVKGGMGPDLDRKGLDQFSMDVPKGFWAGLSGKKKSSFQEVVPVAGLTRGTNNKVAMGIEGFLYDVLLDPTNLVGAGVGKSAIKGVDEVADAAKALSKVDDAPKASAKVLEAVKAAAPAEKAVDVSGRRAAAAAKLSELDDVPDAVRLTDEAVSPPPVGDRPKGFPKGSMRETLPADYRRTANGRIQHIKSGKFVKEADVVMPPPVVKPLGLGPLASKVVAGGKKSTPLKAILEDVAQPSLFGVDELAEAAVTKAPPAPQAIPTARTPPADPGVPIPGLTDRGAPIRRALELRVAGKPVVSSARAYEKGSQILKPLRESGVGQTLSQSFRTGHGLMPEVHNLQRIYSGQGRQTVADKAKEIHRIYQGSEEAGMAYPKVNKDGQKLIFRAIQDDAVDALPPELKIPAQYTQVELAKLKAMDTGGAQALPGMDLKAGKFDEIPTFKGSDKVYDTAPTAFIAQFDRAIRKKAYRDFQEEIAKRFPDNMAEIKGHTKRMREVFGVEGENSGQWLHFMNSVQGPWKRWVTSYRPGFHVRNMIGDSFNAYLAGTNPGRFADAARVLAVEHGDDAAKRAIKIGGKSYSPSEVEFMYRKGGLETSFIETEVVGGSQRGLAHAVTEFGQKREKFTRLATFIDSMDKAMLRGASQQSAIEKAAFRVRKYHFDYTDLTPTERKIRTFIPFYTYTRNELPLLLEHTLSSPHKIVAPQKAGSAIETMFGVEHDPDDPFPGISGLLPEYMRDHQIIQRGDNKVFQPGVPTDLLNVASPGLFIKEQVGSLAPLIKAPIELSTGKSVPLGYDLWKPEKNKKGQTINATREEQLLRYLFSYGPYGNLARDSKSPLSERLLNLLTGAGSGTVR